MKRRLVLAATALAILGGSVAAASAAQPSNGIVKRQPDQFCLVLFYDDGGEPGHLCVNL